MAGGARKVGAKKASKQTSKQASKQARKQPPTHTTNPSNRATDQPNMQPLQ